MTHQPSIVPENSTGKAIDIIHSIQLNNEEEAQDTYNRACKRLLNPPVWHLLAGFESADFAPAGADGSKLERLIELNDLIKINIPGPGNNIGDGFDWVKVTHLQNNVLPDAVDSTGLILQPAHNPMNDKNGTAHFFKENASSVFIIDRRGLTVTASYFGRNEVPNFDGDFVNIIRNGLIAAGAFLGFSNMQWDALVKGLLIAEIGG